MSYTGKHVFCFLQLILFILSFTRQVLEFMANWWSVPTHMKHIFHPKIQCPKLLYIVPASDLDFQRMLKWKIYKLNNTSFECETTKEHLNIVNHWLLTISKLAMLSYLLKIRNMYVCNYSYIPFSHCCKKVFRNLQLFLTIDCSLINSYNPQWLIR